MILLIRTDNPDAYVGLFSKGEVLVERSWQANRELSDTILAKIEELLNNQTLQWSDLSGINVFKGPGSFTGLRIGVTVANTLSESLRIPVIGTQGNEWIQSGAQKIDSSQTDKIVVPEYGGEANITKPRK